MLLDIRVMDTDANSYCHRSVAAVISTAEEEKKRKSNTAVEGRSHLLLFQWMEGSNINILRRTAEVLAWKMWERLWFW